MNTKALSPREAFRAELTSANVQSQLGLALPKHVSKERFSRVLMTSVVQNPALLDAKRVTLFQSAMTIAQLGLLPDAVLGEAYLVPYKDKVQPQIGYKGMLKLARQSGQISTVETGIIHSKDEFIWEMGVESKFSVKPALGDRGEPIAVFAILRYKDGGFEYEVMTVDEIEKIRKASPSGNSPAWKNSWGEMARKTVLRRVLKRAPLSTEAAQAVAFDEAQEERGELYRLSGGGLELEDGQPAPQRKASAKKGSAVSKMEQLAAQATDAEPADTTEGEGADAEWQGRGASPDEDSL